MIVAKPMYEPQDKNAGSTCEHCLEQLVWSSAACAWWHRKGGGRVCAMRSLAASGSELWCSALTKAENQALFDALSEGKRIEFRAIMGILSRGGIADDIIAMYGEKCDLKDDLNAAMGV